MTAENTTFLDLIEQRTELMRSLSASLLGAGSAIVAFDIDALESRVAQQQQLCAEIQKLDAQREHLQSQCAARPHSLGASESFGNTVELRGAKARLHQAHANVKQLNSVHEALLKRSRRTVTALLNSLYSFEGSYRVTALQQSALPAERQESA
jgi:hypothetical protein